MDNDEIAYLEEVRHLTEWCYDSNMDLNIEKTKEITLDFRKLKYAKYPAYMGRKYRALSCCSHGS